MFERKMVVFVAMRGERKGGKRKSFFIFIFYFIIQPVLF